MFLGRGLRCLKGKLAAYCRRHAWRQAVALLFAEGDADVVTYGMALAACDRLGSWQEALALLRQAPELNVVLCNAAMSACGRAQRWAEACELLHEMPHQQLVPDVISFNSAMRGGSWRVALLLRQQMVEQQLEPSRFTTSTATSLCARSNAWQAALAFLALAKDLDAAAFSSVLQACGRSRRWQRSLQLFEELKEVVTPDVPCYNAAISAAERGGHWRGALSLWSGMRESRLRADLITRNALLSACEKGRRWQVALLIFDSKSHSKVSYTALLSALTKGKAWQLGLGVLEQMRSQELEPTPLHYAAILEARGEDEELRRRLELSVRRALHDLEVLQGVEARQEAAKYAVAGLEALMRGPKQLHMQLEETLELFRVVLFRPVLAELAALVDRPPAGRLQEQYGLGKHFTQEALKELGLASDDLWKMNAQQKALELLHEVPERAQAQHLVVYSSYILQLHGRHFEHQGRATWAHDLIHATPFVPLWPIFVEHDRSSHAERVALLKIIQELLEAGAQPHDFPFLEGHVWLYAVHTPCISCLAAFRQFQRAFPKVSLQIAFHDWRQTREAKRPLKSERRGDQQAYYHLLELHFQEMQA